jgi:Domain of unknown function (DUF4440)
MSWRKAIFSTLVIAWSVTGVGAQDDRRALSVQETLIQLERDWDTAFLHNDVGFIETVLAEEFLATYDDGNQGDRAKELELAAAFNKQIESSTLDGFTVKLYGDTAVVWFRRHLAGPSGGRRLELTFHFTDVFVYRAGRWQCVASHSTRVMGT